MTDLATRKADLFAKSTDEALIGALEVLDGNPRLDADGRLVRAWTIEELERRHPAASAAVEKAFDEAEATGGDVDYVSVLINAIKGA